MKRNLLACCALFIAACATPVLPSNVETRSINGNNSVIDRVNHSFEVAEKPSFEKIRICVIENVRNEAVTVEDSSNSFVGRYTGNVYNVEREKETGGGETIRYLDEESSTLIASGTSQYTHALLMQYLQYDVKITAKSDTKVGMIFTRINAAQKDTGYMKNSGFRPVGTWGGAGAPAALQAIQAEADRLKNCITRPEEY